MGDMGGKIYRERGKKHTLRRGGGRATFRLENGKIKRSLIAAVLDAVMGAIKGKLASP